MDLTDYNLTELKKKEKTSKMSLGILFGLVLVMYGVQVIDFIENKKFNARMLLPITFTFVMLSNYMNLNKIKNEILSREKNNNIGNQ